MRKISLLLISILLSGMYSCKNQPWEFPDFDYTTTYFPYQYPVRTLVLGDYVFDNENDNNLKFIIYARVGGMYTNHSNWTVNYQIDPELVTGLFTAPNLWDGKTNASQDTLVALPTAYYTISPENQFVISEGSFMGAIEVQLTDAFLNDPLAVKTKYVIPLRITTSNADSILAGTPTIPNADPRIASQWVAPPKNFTIFGIKYVNPYHGKYLHRGKSIISDITTSTVLETIVYRQKYVEQDEIWALQTDSRDAVTVTGTLRRSPSSPGKFSMRLSFDNNNNCVITTASGSDFPVSGTGKFVPNGDMWGNKPQNAIHLNYVITEGANQHAITDTLVFRDKAVIFQEYAPVIIP